MIKAAVASLRDIETLMDKKGEQLKCSADTLTSLKAIEGMFHVLCVDKENAIGGLVNEGRLAADSPIAIFRDKILEFKGKSQEELKELAVKSLSELKVETDPDKRANAYLNLSALYYTQKNDPEFKAQLKEGLVEFAAKGYQSEREAVAGAIYMAHTSWDKLSAQQLNVICNSPIKDLVLPFASILTNVVAENDPNAVTSKAGWQEFFKQYGSSSTQGVSETTQEVLKQRMRLLEVEK